MKISKKGLAFIADFEGYHKELPNGDCTTYYCPARVLTIGYGCTENIVPGEVWTHEKALEMFHKELVRHEEFVTKHCAYLNPDQGMFDMLVSFSYNCGTGVPGKPGLGGLTQLTKDFTRSKDQIASALTLYNKGGGKVLPGLVRRRADEKRIFLYGHKVDTSGAVSASTAQEMQLTKHSSKTSVLDWAQKILAGLGASWGFGEWMGALEKVKQFAWDNKTLLLAGAGMAVFLFFSWLKYKQQQDFNEGNYVPSGMDTE